MSLESGKMGRVEPSSKLSPTSTGRWWGQATMTATAGLISCGRTTPRTLLNGLAIFQEGFVYSQPNNDWKILGRP